ncbi:MAG: CBS domain-containing protein [Saprospiraceae bacterium]|nr:CBS domain-containing protein [Saprospiraceae bacterium]MCB9324784.1 CBS domain-containing protein [Lewinellaceae bacterium]
MMTVLVKIMDVMTTEVVAVKATDTMDRVSLIFNSKEIHHIPVVNPENKVVGIISKTDYHKLEHGFTLFRSKESQAYNDAIMRSLLASDAMTKQVVTLLPTESISVAVDIFRENLFHAIPVVDEHQKLVGILTTYDLLNYAFRVPGLIE